MDNTDARILRALQRDSSRPVAELATELNLSASACHRRIKALEASGIISGYSARLSRRKMGFSLLVFVEITLRSQERSVLDGFEAAVRASTDILECHLTSGQADYTLRVVARDMDDYDRIPATAWQPCPMSPPCTPRLRCVPSSSGRAIRSVNILGLCLGFHRG